MDTVPEVVELPAGPAIGIRAQLTIAELPRFFGEAFCELSACGGDQIAGPPFAAYHGVSPDRIDVEALLPLRSTVPARGRVRATTLAGGPAVQIRHIGPYEELGATYASIGRWLASHRRAAAGPVREIYLSEPSVPATERVTLVVQPLRAG